MDRPASGSTRSSRALSRPRSWKSFPRDSPVFESYLRNTPLGGVSDPAEIASVVAFLLGAGSCRITGQSIAVDGGHNLRSGPDFRPFTGLSRNQLLAQDEAG